MSQEVASLSRSPGNFAVISVDKDISFVVNSNDVNYKGIFARNKNIGVARKTFSKKHPLSYNPCVSFSDDSISVMSNAPRSKKTLPFKNSPQSSNQDLGKGIRRKRPTDPESDCPVPRKGRKNNVSGGKVPQTLINGRISHQFKKKSQSNQDCQVISPDSDIEIVDIIEAGPSRSDLFRHSLNNAENRLNDSLQVKNSPKPLHGILKRTSYPSSYNVPITEADTAPIMPSYSGIRNVSVDESAPDVPSSMKWLSANGTIAFSPMQSGPCSAKESAMKYADKYNLYIPEMKISDDEENEIERRPKTKRELKNLYKNLNEISWANEKTFKQMLSSTDGRHSERITAKETEKGKTLRRIRAGALKNLKLTSTKRRPGPAKRNSTKLVQRAKYGKLKPKFLVKQVPRSKVAFRKVNKIAKPVMKPRKLVIKSVTKPDRIKVVRKTVIKPNKVKVTKPVVKPNKDNVKKSIRKDRKSDSKPTVKPVKSNLKSSKEKTEPPKNGPRPKSGTVPKAKASSSKDIASTSGSFQNHVAHCSHTASNSVLFSAFGNNLLKTDSLANLKDSSFVKELKNMEVANELELLKNCLGEEKVAAMKKGSKLQVRVEPLQHSKFWNAEFYETFKKHVLEQALLQTLERRDQESINTMFQELQEACFNPPNNVKQPLKKKKPEEECLRTSVRQSEGAFRYKEIVVKKHESYMQFVLVPNASKRNSLTMEAMKELREAFLLAKKDPNCRAVLLNSSGTYFCTGIDLALLVGNNKKQAAEEMASTIRDLVLTLSTFTKPVIAAVNGTAVGFGVSLLTYCDVVLASDKATFCIPATRLGYLPEGAITLTLPQVVGSGVATEMLLYGRRLTAEQALRHGLVSEVLWPTQLMNEVVPRIQTIVSQPLQVMEATKTMVRCHLWDKLKTHIEREWRLLPPLWLDAQCQHNIKRTLQTGWLVD